MLQYTKITDGNSANTVNSMSVNPIDSESNRKGKMIDIPQSTPIISIIIK